MRSHRFICVPGIGGRPQQAILGKMYYICIACKDTNIKYRRSVPKNGSPVYWFYHRLSIRIALMGSSFFSLERA